MTWVRWGSALMFLAVAFGAFGAHGLKAKTTPELLTIFETGVKYHIAHALALFVVAWLSSISSDSFLSYAGGSFLAGILLFSGSLYVLTLTGQRAWGMITPLGGILFLAGWIFLFLAARRI